MHLSMKALVVKFIRRRKARGGTGGVENMARVGYTGTNPIFPKGAVVHIRKEAGF
jgi:hypothetical protein